MPVKSGQDPYWLRPMVCTTVGLVGNITLSAGKLAAGIFSGSSALIADGAHSLSDVASDLGIMLALKASTRPPDHNHPYGHHSFETLGAIVVALIMLATAGLIGRSAVMNFVQHIHHSPTWPALATALVSVGIKELMARYTIAAGRHNNSPALLANGTMHRSDAISSLAAALGITGALLGWPMLDSVAALAIALLILKLGGKLLVENVMALMDTMPDDALVKRIEDSANGVAGVQEVRSLHVRQRGSRYLVDLRLAVAPENSIATAHDIAHAVEDQVRDDIATVDRVFVHVEPGSPR